MRIIGLALLGYAALIFGVQRWLAFPGTFRDSPRSTPGAPNGVEQLWLETSFGRVEAWYFRSEGSESAPTVIFAHGNGELIDDWQVEMEQLGGAGVNALIVEYPGYGHSEGKPTRATLREAYGVAFDWLVEPADVDAARIVAWGRSMGGGAAGDLAMDRPVRALILQSTFSSAMAMARESLVPGFLVRDRFDNHRVVQDFAGPILLMHGLDDDVIGYGHATALAGARPGLVVTPIDCAHNDCGRVWPQIAGEVTTFLREVGLLEG